MLIPIDEVVTFDVVCHNPATGGVSDADSGPTYDVFEETTDTPILDDQTLTKRTSLTGNYRGQFTASTANGFEAGKWYSVVATATVNSVTGKTVAMHFRCAPAESSAGVPKVDVSHYGGTAGTFSGGRPEVNTTHAAGTAWNSGAITASTIANGAIDAATFAADVDAEILSYLVDDATRIDASALNTASAAVGSNGAGLTEAGGTGDHLTAVPWNAAWDTEVQSEVDDALVARHLDHLVIVAGTADSGSTTTMVDAARTEGDNDYWKGKVILFTSGNIAGQAVIITDFVAASDTFTFRPATTQAVSTQDYVILPNVSVWEDLTGEHLASGSTGESLNAAGAAGDPWTTALPGAYGAGTAG